MIPPSGSGRSAPLPAMSEALRKDHRTPHIPGVARASGSMRRGATASRGRYESAPPLGSPPSAPSAPSARLVPVEFNALVSWGEREKFFLRVSRPPVRGRRANERRGRPDNPTSRPRARAEPMKAIVHLASRSSLVSGARRPTCSGPAERGGTRRMISARAEGCRWSACSSTRPRGSPRRPCPDEAGE